MPLRLWISSIFLTLFMTFLAFSPILFLIYQKDLDTAWRPVMIIMVLVCVTLVYQFYSKIQVQRKRTNSILAEMEQATAEGDHEKWHRLSKLLISERFGVSIEEVDKQAEVQMAKFRADHDKELETIESILSSPNDISEEDQVTLEKAIGKLTASVDTTSPISKKG